MPKFRILLADDEKPYLMAIGDFFREEGCQVECVENAEDIKERAPTADVLVVDVRLPSTKCEGIDAVRDLLGRQALRPGVPLVFMSIDPKEDPLMAAALRRSGIPDDRYCWLQKPFELTHLLSVIASEQVRLRGKSARSHKNAVS